MIKRNTEQQRAHFDYRRFLVVWMALTVMIAAGILVFYAVQAKSLRVMTEATERQAVELARLASKMGLATIQSDLLFLADRVSSHLTASTGALQGREQLTSNFLAFAQRKGVYDQIRYLDTHGQEIIRIDYKNDHAYIVPARDLQNKSHRYYVSKTLELAHDEIYVSPLDLNIERNRIQRPFKPVIRFGTPIFDPQGHRTGIVVVNYLAQRLINRILTISKSKQVSEHIWLLNSNGYWLLGPHPEDEWGFMFPERKDKRLGVRDASAWKAIENGAQEGQFLTRQGLYTYAKIVPYQPIGSSDISEAAGPIKSEYWILVAQVPTAALNAQTAGLTKRLGIVFVVLVLAFAIAAWLVAFYSSRRRWAEAVARASEARFRAVLESAPDAILIVNGSGRITLANAQAEKYFGYTRDELLEQPVEMLVPEYLRERHGEHRADFSSHPEARAMGLGLDLQGQRKDGSGFPVEISLSPLETPQGMAVTAIIRDITTRRQAERLREETQARYHELVNNLPVGIYRSEAGVDGRFLEANPAMLAMFEAVSAERFFTFPARSIYRDADSRRQLNELIVNQGTVASVECEMITMTGRVFWAAISAVKKQTPEGKIYFDGMLEDITERKAIESQLQQLNASLRSRSTELEIINHELEAFSYSVSHDLRSPLRAIDGFSRILLSDYADRLDEVGRDRLDRVRRAAQHMGMLIDDLLKLSRVSRADLTRETVDLTALATEVADEQTKQAADRTVQFVVSPGLAALGDKRLLRIALDNLLSNAWKFTGKCLEARIEVGMDRQRDIPVYFVRDNGAGFDMAYADKLFGVFQRLHDAGEFPGTGIGLATVQRIIHKHGGRIWAESAVNQGTVFYFTLESEPS